MVFLEAVHITNKFAQHGDTLITSVTNMPEQIDVQVTNLPDSMGLANDLSAFHNIIDTIESVVQHISHSGAGYPDWATDIVFPLVIAIFALIFPILVSVIARLDERYKASIYTTIVKVSWQYMSFVVSLALTGFCVLTYAISYGVQEDSWVTNVSAVALIIFTCAVVLFTIVLLRYLLITSSHTFLVDFLRNSINDFEFSKFNSMSVIKNSQGLFKEKRQIDKLQIFELVCKYALDTKDNILMESIQRDFYLPLMDVIAAHKAKMVSGNESTKPFEDVLLSALERIHQYAYKETSCMLRSQLKTFVTEFLLHNGTIPTKALMNKISSIVMNAEGDSTYFRTYFRVVNSLWARNAYKAFAQNPSNLSSLQLQKNAISYRNRNFIMCALLSANSHRITAKIETMRSSVVNIYGRPIALMPQTLEELLALYFMLMYRIERGKYTSLSDDDIKFKLQTYVLYYAQTRAFVWSKISGNILLYGIDVSMSISYLLSLFQVYSNANSGAELLQDEGQLNKFEKQLYQTQVKVLQEAQVSETLLQSIYNDVANYSLSFNVLCSRLCRVEKKCETIDTAQFADNFQKFIMIPKASLLDHYVDSDKDAGENIMQNFDADFRNTLYENIRAALKINTTNKIDSYKDFKHRLKKLGATSQNSILLSVGLSPSRLLRQGFVIKDDKIQGIPVIFVSAASFRFRWRNSMFLINRDELPRATFYLPTQQKIKRKNWQLCTSSDLPIYTCINEKQLKKGEIVEEFGVFSPLVLSPSTVINANGFVIAMYSRKRRDVNN